LVCVSGQPITRNRVTTEELQWIISWILDHSSVQSGTESIRVLLQYSTIQEAYEHYVEETIQNTMFIVHSQSFLKWIHSLGVHFANFKRYLCPICSSVDKVQIFQYHSVIDLYLRGIISSGQEKSTSTTRNN
jgi:hypothetical protein